VAWGEIRVAREVDGYTYGRLERKFERWSKFVDFEFFAKIYHSFHKATKKKVK